MLMNKASRVNDIPDKVNKKILTMFLRLHQSGIFNILFYIEFENEVINYKIIITR